jgi:DNA helicase-2/ATP-dependent DNA helicase PcrA
MNRQIPQERQTDFAILLEAWSLVNENVNRFPHALSKIRDHAVAAAEKAYDGARAEYALIVQDMAYLHDCWQKYAHDHPMDNRSLAHFRNRMAIGLASPIEKQNGLALATVHAAKGLEFDIVFLMGMVERTFPDYRAIRQRGKALEEEKNEAFVAMTRAKRFLFITWPKAKFMPWDQATRTGQRMSRYLKSLPTDTFEVGLEQLRVAEDCSR